MEEKNSTNDSVYCPDIDGLRAIAVLAVVTFHAFPNWVKGGFIGVDMFFVISGYLISVIIFKNLNDGTFSFSDFYSRRIKRIFPSLILVLTWRLRAGLIKFRIVIKPGNPTLWQGLSVRSSLNFYN
jgi:peptidoglycan/LPS O-acetylase OafA/YrhL